MKKSVSDLTRRSAQFARFVQNLQTGEHLIVIKKGDGANAIHWDTLDTVSTNSYTNNGKSQESRPRASDNTGRD